MRESAFRDARIVRVHDGVYCAIGYALSNVAMIAVPGGKVIVDATESLDAAREIRQEFDKLVTGPVKVLIYTHSHADHILGASVFRDEGTEIIAHAHFVEEVRTQLGTMSPTYQRRAARQFGVLLPDEEYSAPGIGPALRLDSETMPPLLFPTRTFRDRLVLELGDVIIELEEAPGETRDHLFTYLPRTGTVFAGDNIYRAFPNIYAIRGSTPRPVRHWIESLDRIRELEPQHLVLGHTDPVAGKGEIAEILTAYRDAMSFLLASVIRCTNNGMSLDEIVDSLSLPPHLARHTYLQPTYGRVDWAIRGIYESYLGWFGGNATHLQTSEPKARANRWLALAGGVPRVQHLVQQELASGDPQWAAELCDLLLDQEPLSARYRRWKAEALIRLANRVSHPIARNYYRVAAAEMLDFRGSQTKRATLQAETLKDVPMDVLMQSLPMRLRSDLTADLMLRVGFEFSDTGNQFTFYIRRGVGEIRRGRLDRPDFVVSATESDFKAVATGTLPPTRAILTRRIRCSGGILKLRFLRSLLHPL